MSGSNSNPLSFKNLLAGIIVTVIGGVILTFILQGVLSPRNDSGGVNPPNTNAPIADTPLPVDTIAPTENNACVNAPVSRLSVGAGAVVCTKSDSVILRAHPQRTAAPITRLSSGARLAVIGGPTCDENEQWWYWQVRAESGVIGWVAEGGDEVDPYFVCPGN